MPLPEPTASDVSCECGICLPQTMTCQCELCRLERSEGWAIIAMESTSEDEGEVG
jgi:hypothetical protein